MTPEKLANAVPQLLEPLLPPSISAHGADPVSLCQWLNRNTDRALPSSPLGPLWPRLPQIEANDYSLAQAPQSRQLNVRDSGPIQMASDPGTNKQGQRLPALEHCRQVGGHVIACNGEVAFARTDLVIPGPLAFHWQRFYRHSNTEDLGLGVGWRHSLSEQLRILEDKVELHTAEGRFVRFKLPAIGHSSYNRFERLLLHRQSLHSYRISGFDQAQRIFRADGFNSALPLVEIRDSSGNSFTVDYQQGLPGKIVSSWGRVVEFHCRERHIEQLVNRHAPSGHQSLCEYRYDDSTQLLTDVGAGLQRERYQYREELLAAIDSSRHGQLQFGYDNQQRCYRVQSNQLIQTLSWRKAQRRCTLKSAGRHPVQWTFNEFGQLIGDRQQERESRYLYDLYGNLCQATTSDGRTIYRHDELGRLVRHSRNNLSERYVYDQCGFLAGAQQRGEQIWQFMYGEGGQPLQIVDPAERKWQCQYSERGQLLQLTDPEGGRTELSWDSQGQLLRIQRGDRQWKFEYDHWQQLTALTVDGETRRQWHYGQAGELKEIHLGEYRYQLDYDDRGRPCALHAGEIHTLRWHCDEAGNCRQLLFADGREWRMDYNAWGQLVELQSDGYATHWQYDEFGQLSACRGSDDRRWQWRYDAGGKVQEFRDNDARWYLHYSERGELQQIRNNSGQQCEFHYDRQQRLVQVNNACSSVRFQYDSRNLLITEHHDSKEAGSITLEHRYDARGWLKSSSSDNLYLTYLLAPDGELYGIDANGEAALRCETQTQAENWLQGRVHSLYRYQAGQLVALETDRQMDWQFDTCAPIRLARPATRQPPADSEAARDMRGNITRELRGGKQRRKYLYQYDGWGLLSSAECGDFKTYFRYDPFGRRLSKLTTHRKTTRQRRVNTAWYSLGVWSETYILNGKAQPATHYLHHPTRQTLLCRWREEELQHYLLTPCGEPLARFDHQGELLWPAAADSGGGSGASDQDPWRGRGRIADSETGLHYSWQGYWHPQLQTWLHATEPHLQSGQPRASRPYSAREPEHEEAVAAE